MTIRHINLFSVFGCDTPVCLAVNILIISSSSKMRLLPSPAPVRTCAVPSRWTWAFPALASKYPAADKSCRVGAAQEWQYVFPSRDLSVDPCTLAIKRHHLHPSGVQRVITAAVHAAGIPKRATDHTLRAAFAHRLKEAGCQLDDIQKLMGAEHSLSHDDIRTTPTNASLQHYLEGQTPAHKRLRGPLSSKN
ncbi:MAG: tyrosine-type recombinase/integrase [Chloroflexota bacterium]